MFEVERGSAAVTVLEEAGIGIADDRRIVIRREIARSGRHRAFVNDSAVTVGLLERLGDQLVEVHGQHEHQRLLEPVQQLTLLDRFLDVEADRDQVASLFARYRAARDEAERIRASDRDRAQRTDLLRFQVSELDAARIRVGEEEELRGELRRLKNVERFTTGLAEVTELLSEDSQSVVTRLARSAHVLSGLARLDDAFGAPVEGLGAAATQVEDVLLTLRALRDALACEPGRLEVIEDRLDALTRLKRKYGDTEEAMLAHRAVAAEELDRLSRHGEMCEEQERLAAAAHADLMTEAAKLSERRRVGARKLAAQTEREIRALGLDRAVFQVVVERQPDEAIGARGLDRVEFRLSTNPGEDPKPLARVASGGELSRTMLGLLTVLSTADPVSTMVFDEVDAGVGGAPAAIVADKLAVVAEGRQVLCVTHLAPIAARAQHQVRVSKTVRGGRTRAVATALAGPDRIKEIARMLGGDAASETALRHARELLARRARATSAPV